MKGAMTLWWLGLVAMTHCTVFICETLGPLLSIHNLDWSLITCSKHEQRRIILWDAINCLRGMAMASGICVGVGYYTFGAAFWHLRKHSVQWEFYQNGTAKERQPFWLYVAADTAIHVVFTSLHVALWWQHLSLLAAVLAFGFHRAWSYVNSDETTFFYHGDDTYGFARVPAWVWHRLYGTETSLLAVLALIGILRGRLW